MLIIFDIVVHGEANVIFLNPMIDGGVMQLSGLTMPGYRVYEYLLILQPHEELRNRVIQVKKDWSRIYEMYLS